MGSTRSVAVSISGRRRVEEQIQEVHRPSGDGIDFCLGLLLRRMADGGNRDCFREVLTKRLENLVKHQWLIKAFGMFDGQRGGDVQRLTVLPVMRLIQIREPLAESHACGREVHDELHVFEIVTGVIGESARKRMQRAAGKLYGAVDAVARAGPAPLHFFQRVAKHRRGFVRLLVQQFVTLRVGERFDTLARRHAHRGQVIEAADFLRRFGLADDETSAGRCVDAVVADRGNVFAVEGSEQDGLVPQVVACELQKCDDGAGDSDCNENRRAENPPAPVDHFVSPQDQIAERPGEEPIETEEDDRHHEAHNRFLGHVHLLGDVIADVQFRRRKINRRLLLL